MWCLRISGSNSSTGARHQVNNDLATSLFGGSLSFFWVAGQQEVIFMRRGVPRDMATPLKISPERSSCQGEFANVDVQSQALQAPDMMADDVFPVLRIEVLVP